MGRRAMFEFGPSRENEHCSKPIDENTSFSGYTRFSSMTYTSCAPEDLLRRTCCVPHLYPQSSTSSPLSSAKLLISEDGFLHICGVEAYLLSIFAKE